MDTNKAEGIKGTYLFSNKLNNEEIQKLLNNVDSLKLALRPFKDVLGCVAGNKKKYEYTMPKC